jgi:hypothetical protein
MRLLANGTLIPFNNFDIPSIHKVDLRLQKRLTLGRARIDGIVELFNAFNHANFGLPNANSGDGVNFGRVSSARAPRLIQFCVKLLF